ncbi:MAG: hypothetical protein R3F11_13850 [Verrucomicrobiales bacterium]
MTCSTASAADDHSASPREQADQILLRQGAGPVGAAHAQVGAFAQARAAAAAVEGAAAYAPGSIL